MFEVLSCLTSCQRNKKIFFPGQKKKEVASVGNWLNIGSYSLQVIFLCK